MKDEVLKILGELEAYYDRDITTPEIKLIRDYITNLQEENKRLKDVVENLTTMTVCGDRKQIKNTAQYKLDIYKSRNKKAVEIYKNRNTCKYKKERLMKDKSTSDLMYEALTGGDKDVNITN